jgi:hypothetical protein
MEVDFEGGLQYGGGFRGRVAIWRWILEADFIWRWNMGADFNMELDFFMTGMSDSLRLNISKGCKGDGCMGDGGIPLEIVP